MISVGKKKLLDVLIASLPEFGNVIKKSYSDLFIDAFEIRLLSYRNASMYLRCRSVVLRVDPRGCVVVFRANTTYDAD